MFAIYVIITLLLLCGCRVCRKGGFNDGYISKRQCNVVKGFFIAVVFCRHIAPYLADAGYGFSFGGDGVFRFIDGEMGQLLVVMFLFYSGYGVMESVKKKGHGYVEAMPRRRVLPTLLNFDVAVFCFLVVDLLLGIGYTAKDTLLAFTGWTSIGNSNWYIFVILCCYMSTYLTCRMLSRTTLDRRLIGGGNLCIIACVYLALLVSKPGYWFDTIFAYPLGVYYSLYKEETEKAAKRHYNVALPASVLAFVLLICCPFWMKGLYANLRGCVMAIVIVLLSMKAELQSKPLEWMGSNLFPLYIYQRIGMIVLGRISGGGFISAHPYWYIVGSVLLALLFGWAYRYVQIKIKV